MADFRIEIYELKYEFHRDPSFRSLLVISNRPRANEILIIPLMDLCGPDSLV